MSFLKKIIHSVKRQANPSNWHNLRNTVPVSAVFGLDRGTPIDRYYIEEFLRTNKSLITGDVLEIAESYYSKKFGKNIESFEILHYNNDNPKATIVGDLTKAQTLPADKIDCFICTQTFQFIYNYMDAIRGAHHLLKKGGVLLATFAGISQISRYDMDRWGDYWRFTTLSATKSFAEIFGNENVKVDWFGNVLSSISFLEGITAEELSKKELDFKDENYQLLITVVARK
jgi:hypothetical protein